MVSLVLSLVLSAANAAEPENWADLHKGRLYATLDADVEQAITIYETILYHISQDDPQRGQLLYWLGHAKMKAGDLAGARVQLVDAQRFSAVRQPATELLRLIGVWEGRVDTLPHAARPDVLLKQGDVWQLAFGEMEGSVQEIRVKARAEGGPTVLRLALQDQGGRELPALDTIQISDREWTEFTIEPSDFRLSAQAQGQPRPLWLMTLELYDLAATEDVRIRIAEVDVR
ncbi:MAG: hypothetical protein AAFV53_39365 [Myxococcota bacterium]